MPYKSNKDLPKQAQGLSDHEKNIWRKAFNAALKQYGSEEKAAKVAWAAVKKSKETGRVIIAENFKVEYGVPLMVTESVDEKFLEVRGVAVTPISSRNKIKYVPEELKLAVTSSALDIPILKDHKNEIDSLVGRASLFFNENTGAIDFNGKILDESIKEKVSVGLIQNVSIGAFVKELEEIEENGDYIHVARGIEIVELSITPVPGVKTATIACAIAECLNCSQLEIPVGANKEEVLKMTDEVNEKAEVVESKESLDKETSELEALRAEIKELKEKIDTLAVKEDVKEEEEPEEESEDEEVDEQAPSEEDDEPEAEESSKAQIIDTPESVEDELVGEHFNSFGNGWEYWRE